MSEAPFPIDSHQLTNGDIEMVDGDTNQAVEALPSESEHDNIGTSAFSSAPNPSIQTDISNPPDESPAVLPPSYIELPQEAGLPSGNLEPAPTPALQPLNTSPSTSLDTAALDTTLNTTLNAHLDSTNPTIPTYTTHSSPPTKAPSPAPPSPAVFLPTTNTSTVGAGSPARGSTPVPGASVGGLAPSAIIPPAAGTSGSPTRVYVNTKVTPVLLEGLKWVARNEPEKPLKWLGEYLMRRSAEVEGS